ncbi:MAG TPA: hypothetical protein VN860_02240 [Candidatus Acidoferrales bacterium]|nr:hypothetical protein [Candidatus Acidoferrales bacterium]
MKTLAVALLLGAVGLVYAAPNVDFNNFTYATNPCGPNPTTMRNGHGDYEGPPDQGVPTFSLDMGAVYRGRLGQRDAAVVVLSCGLPVGSGSSADAYAINGSHATYLKHLGEVSAGSGGYPPSSWLHVRFAGDLLYVDRLADPEMYPHRWTVTTYRLRGDKLSVVNVLVHQRRERG